jgi:hypothetical protein
VSGNRGKFVSKGLLAALFLFYVPGRATGLGEQPRWNVLEVVPADSAALELLHSTGIEVLSLGAGKATVLANPLEQTWLGERGFTTRVLIEDYGLYLARQRQAGPRPAAAGGFASGSMGGFFSPKEIEAFVDSLIRNDRNGIITQRFEFGRSHENRPLWAIRVSDNAAVDEDEPEVLYNSLIHAREGAGVMCLLYYLKWLIDNYGKVDTVTALVESREMYFIPLVNPDGYERNWQIYSGGGGFGLWRKNRRDNDGDGVVEFWEGVDLNRNFSFMWGYDNSGSSPYESQDSYRGPSAFSEPESRALRDYINLRQFACAVNFHSYSSVLINPWGYADLQPPDSLLYARLGRELTAENRYRPGSASRTLGYRVNGELTDWEYGDSSHPKIMAWSIEIGLENPDNFWPPVNRIEYLCDLNLPFCFTLARLAGFTPSLDSLRVEYSGADSAGFMIGFRLTNRGYPSNPGPLTVRLESAETRLNLPDSSLVLPDISLDSLVRVSPEGLRGAFTGKLERAALDIALYAGEKRLISWPVTVSRPVVRYYDLDSSGRVDVFDLLAFLRRLSRGPAPGVDDSLYDLNDDNRVDVFDLLALLRKL